ncbi:MAG: ACP S-malonyltransferase [Parvibaculales bacterium]
MSYAFTFPGQGSQAVMMGKELADQFAEARLVFEEIDEALGQSLSNIMWAGPEDTLTLTENAQPALMAVSMAVMRVLESKGFCLADQAAYVAGHSLGEYAALAAAGTFSLSDTARLLKTRGQAMQQAVPVGEGSMAALLGLDFATVTDIASHAAGADEVCSAANDNAPGQVVVSGSKAAVERACELAKEAGAKRAMPLPVSAPFHCSLMAPAAERMAVALSEVEMSPPVVPLVANVTAAPTSDPNVIRDQLVQQVTGVVRWSESVTWLGDNGVTHLVEVGSGKVLSGLARRINKELGATALNTGADIDAFLETI